MGNILYNNIVIDPSEELAPFVSIAALNRQNFCPKFFPETPRIDNYLINRFGYKYVITPKARVAITIVLKELSLRKEDVVTILTTSGNPYISSCVTNSIETICRWSREFTPNTKVIFVNHEFGYSFDGLSELKKYNLPIIEDCAHSFFTYSPNIGKIGDYVIYSFPKAFSIQFGGMIVYKDSLNYKPDPDLVKYVKSALEPQVNHIQEYVAKRFENYWDYIENLRELGIEPYFKLTEGDVPGVFMFKWNKAVDFLMLKKFLNSNGIDSSKFFGQEAYFIPVHHNISDCERNFIINLIKYFNENEV